MNNNYTQNVKLVLFDLDGTIYISGKLIPGAKRFLRHLKSTGIEYGFMTNNSSIGPIHYLHKLQSLGLDVSPKNIITSAEAATIMLNDFNISGDIFILGTKSLKKYLSERGYFHRPKKAKAVLIGFDTELKYEDLRDAVRLITAGIPYFATHPDVICPSADGPLPDAGAILSAIKTATGIKPKAIAGKPNRWIVKLACRNFSVKTQNIMIIGDRLQTDIRMANRYKMKSALILSGVTDKKHLQTSKYKPDLIVNSIGDKTLLEYEF